MGVFDVLVRDLSERSAAELAETLIGKGKEIVVLSFVSTTLPLISELRVDHAVLLLVDGKPRNLHVEIQLRWEPDVPSRMLSYSAQMFRRGNELLPDHVKALLNPGESVPVRSVVIVMSGEDCPPPGVHQLHWGWPEAETTPFSYTVVPIHRIAADELLKMPGIWKSFLPFAKGTTLKLVKELLHSMQAQWDTERDPQRRAQLADEALLLTVAAEKQKKIPSMGKVARNCTEVMVMDISDSPLAMSLIAKGETIGFEKGEQKGLKEGEKKGLREGRDSVLEAARKFLSPEDFAKLAASTEPKPRRKSTRAAQSKS